MTTFSNQTPVLEFPSNPTVDQEYVADNGSTYIWTGDRWSTALAIEQKKTRYIIDGGYSISSMDSTLDGNGA